jgi:hypothetical protein
LRVQSDSLTSAQVHSGAAALQRDAQSTSLP